LGGTCHALAADCARRHISSMEKPTKHRPRGTNRSRRRIAAAEGAHHGRTRSGELPANLEFAKGMAGTLPETVTADDLEILNAGLNRLFADLRRAHQFFQDGEGNGRGGAATALAALQRFITLFRAPLAEGLQVPILDLLQALVALENNNVLPVLKPVRRRGRAKSSDAYEALKGCVAETGQRLLQSGVTPADAHRRVAKELGTLGVRPERGAGDVTGTTVRHWCDGVAEDVGRGGTAAMIYDLIFTAEEIERFSRLPSNQARQDFALASLAAFVRKILPRCGPEKPI
jgi:hypothetical protein